MWISKQCRPKTDETAQVEAATVNTALDRVAAASSEQLRALHLLAPGGFAWRPQVGDQLLVMKELALGKLPDCPVELAPGECCLYTQGAYLHLTADGCIRLSGRLQINGADAAPPEE